jgi:hypothetical protein
MELVITLPADPSEALARFQDLRYRLVSNGIGASPLQPQYCALRGSKRLCVNVTGGINLTFLMLSRLQWIRRATLLRRLVEGRLDTAFGLPCQSM